MGKEYWRVCQALPVDFLAAFTTAADRFATLATTSDPSAPVPSCPGWTVTDLVAHVGSIHRWVMNILRTGDPSDVEDQAGPDLAAWYRGRADELGGLLAATDPARPTWNFARVNEVAAFWPRRQTHEVTMHSVDLADVPIDPEIASDGVAEVFEVFGPRLHQRGRDVQLIAPVELRLTDTGRAWQLVARPGAAAALVEPDGTSAAAISGTAAQVYTALWNRSPRSELTVAGDLAAVAAVLDAKLVP